jgi:hypothetical protein
LAELGEQVDNEATGNLFNTMVALELRKWVAKHVRRNTQIPEDAHLDALKIVRALAWQGTKSDASMVATAVISGFAQEEHDSWSDVFKAIYSDDEGYPDLMRKLGESPPTSGVGAALVERANRAYLDDEWEGKHPYDSPAGAKVLADWLKPPTGEDSPEVPAFSAALALAFCSEDTRSGLIEAAMTHPDIDVQFEGAWADAKNGGNSGLNYLKEKCKDLTHSVTAKSYLREIELGNEIPKSAEEPEFAATATMIDWLKHPNELGSPPANIEVFDNRELFWPPSEKRQPVWLFTFTYFTGEEREETIGYGMVGGSTWSSFIEYESPPTPAELYVHHCRLELNRDREEGQGELTDDEVRELLMEKDASLFE